MSAGVMPKLQKQEPWELIQAFVKAQDDATLAAKDAQLRRDLQANSEAAADRRLERQHQLNIDSLKQQLEIKTPYEIAQEKRQEEANQRAAERQHGYALESQDRNTENAIKQHSTNQRNDFDLQIEYAPKMRELQKDQAQQKLESDIERQKQMDELDFTKKKRISEEITTPEKEAEEEAKARSLATQFGLRTDQMLKLEEQRAKNRRDLLDAKIAEAQRNGDTALQRRLMLMREQEAARTDRERMKQDAIGARQGTAIGAKRDLETDRLQAQQNIESFRQGRLDARQQAKIEAELATKGSVEVAPGVRLVDPSQIQMDQKDLGDTSKYRNLGPVTVTTKNGTKKSFIQYQYIGPGAGTPAAPSGQLQRPSVTKVPNPVQQDAQQGGRKMDPELLPPFDPNQLQGGLPPLIPQSVLPGGDQAPPMPPAGSPIEQAMRGDTPVGPMQDQPPIPPELQLRPLPPPDADWLRNAPAPSGRGDRRGDLDTGQLVQLASLALPQGMSMAPKTGSDVDQVIEDTGKLDLGAAADVARRGDQPVTTGGRPDGVTGKYLRTLDQAPKQYQSVYEKAAGRYNLNPDILAAQGYQESKWNPHAVSYAGARGIAQFMPGTAKDYGINPNDPVASIMAQGKYMRRGLDRYGGNLGLALAGYNGGFGRADQLARGDLARIPRAAMAQMSDYVQKITGVPLKMWIAKGTAGNRGADDRTETRGMAAPGEDQAPLPPRRPNMKRVDNDMFLVDV
jgi:hypothetical protein